MLGHRGVRGQDEPPENTLAAFREAHARGADGIEVDVRLDAHGDAVVIHDQDLSRVTGGADERRVARLGRKDFNAVDLGGGEHVPRLTEVLNWAAREGMRVNIELKHDVRSRLKLVRAVTRILRGYPEAPTQFLLSSFDPVIVWLMGRRHRAPTAWLIEDKHRALKDARGWRALGAAAVHPERVLCSPGRVRRWKAAGALVNVWTVNNPLEATHLAALGVDGIITDQPGELIQALG